MLPCSVQKLRDRGERTLSGYLVYRQCECKSICVSEDWCECNSMYVSEDWCAALANMVHIIPSIPEYAISSTLRIYISATKDLAAEVDLLVKVGVGRALCCKNFIRNKMRLLQQLTKT